MDKVINGILNDSDQSTWYKNQIIIINKDILNKEYTKTYNIVDFYIFCKAEKVKWEVFVQQSHPALFHDILNAFTTCINTIEGFITEMVNNINSDTLTLRWIDLESKIIISNSTFLLKFDYPEIEFLKKLWLEYPSAFLGAQKYIFKYTLQSTPTIEEYEGFFLAFNFQHRGLFEDLSQPKIESESIYNIKNDFLDYITLTKQSNIETIEGFKSDQNQLIKDTAEAKKNIEKAYQEVLKLKEPALFWKDRAAEMRKEGMNSLYILYALVAVSVLLLFFVLVLPEGKIFDKFYATDKSTAIRWSITFITLLSFLAYIMGIVSKTMFSSFHIARDCDERYTLTYFYLSLLKDNTIDTKSTELIIQSLFSRTDTGLLKGDSSPTMPGDVLSKIINR